jgi:transcriptional regulator with XRE-family HTH domain
MKRILVELRQWLGLSQAEMALALKVSRSLYSMAELGRRQLDPDSVLLILALHAHMQQAPENEFIRSIEKETQASLLSEAEKEVRFQELRKGNLAKTEKYKESFPRWQLVLPLSGTAGFTLSRI